jgi:hypothetical protein
MKTDLVLTIDEYLDQRCVVPKRLSPPGRDARHISITADSSVEVHSYRCDRWGHPCSGRLKSRPASEQESAILSERK